MKGSHFSVLFCRCQNKSLKCDDSAKDREIAGRSLQDASYDCMYPFGIFHKYYKEHVASADTLFVAIALRSLTLNTVCSSLTSFCIRFWDIISPRDFTSHRGLLLSPARNTLLKAPSSSPYFAHGTYFLNASGFIARRGKKSKRIDWDKDMNELKKWGMLVWIAMSFDFMSIERTILVSNESWACLVYSYIWFHHIKL